ncbi:MAG TPA: alcohol dehydrogenase catalytic domain-containing protein [bacterium]|nr:alcohol dehydrogenase catalytic domain-containing protein [bacterium]
MLAIQTDATGKSMTVNISKPHIGPDEVLIKTIGCGLCGTDLLKINLGLLRQPTILGHEVVGRVAEKGAKVFDYQLGDLIVVAHHVPCGTCHYCLHGNHSMCATFKKTNLDPGGFCEFIRLSKQHLDHTTFKITGDFAWQEALFTEPLACCERSFQKLTILPGDVLVIVGLGSIGIMMTKLVKRLGGKVIGIDTDTHRCSQALSYGADKTIESTDKLHTLINEPTQSRGADGIIFTAGPAGLLNASLLWLRDGGFVNLFSHLSGEVGPIDTSRLYHHEIQIITSYSATPESLKRSFDILRSEHLNLKQMFETYRPDQFEQAVKDMNERKVYKALIEF